MIYLFDDFYIEANDYCYALVRCGKRPKKSFGGNKDLVKGQFTEYKTYLGFYNSVKNALEALYQYKLRMYVKGSENTAKPQRNCSTLKDLLQYAESLKFEIENIKL